MRTSRELNLPSRASEQRERAREGPGHEYIETVAQCDHAITLIHVIEVMEWPRLQMAGMLPFESPSVLDSADPLHFR
jgi:hypothetical protein